MGLPECEVGGPGGGGMGLPDDEVGELSGAGAGPPARGGPPAGGAGGRGAPPACGAGRPGGGAAGRGGRAAAGRSGARAGRGASAGAGADGGAPAEAAGRTAPGSSSRRGGRGGCSLPEDVTRRPGGGGGAGRPAVRCGGAAGGIDGRGFHASLDGRSPPSGDDGDGLAARAGASDAGGEAGSDPLDVAGGALGSADRPEPGEAALAADDPLSALAPLAGFSSGCSDRTRPSRLARRRTRSACASSMPEECVFTPMPRSLERSSVSLFVIPSSLASSWTRIFAAKVVSDQPFVFLWARTAHVVVRIAALHPRADRRPGTNSDQELCARAPTGPLTTLTKRSSERSVTDGRSPTCIESGSTEPRSASRQSTALHRRSLDPSHEADQLRLRGLAAAPDAGALRLGDGTTRRPACRRRPPFPRPRTRRRR
jgi:hypothetical protein